MTGTIELVLGLMIAVAALAFLARKFQLPYPILFVIGGTLLGLIPGLPSLHVSPELIFVVFLPPLLYPAALFTSWREFRNNIRPILTLALGLVLFTTIAVGWFAHHVLGFPWAAGFVLGAIISPPDAAAATAITRTLRVPRRIVAIIDGESLANDATSFIAYRYAIAAAATGVFSLGHATLTFLAVGVGGILVGLVAGAVAAPIQRRLDDPPVQTTISLLTPYVTYIAAESLHVSGILAVVVAGLCLGWRSPETLTSRSRLVVQAVWQTVVFLLNGFLFILIGLQLREVIQHLSGRSISQAIWYAVLLVAVVIVVRILWVFAVTYAPGILLRVTRRYNEELPPWKNVAIVSWAGMRGVYSLAAALSVPLVIHGDSPFPERGLIIFLTFCVIFGTLVLQGLSLPPIIHWLKFSDDHAAHDEERHARLHANRAALEAISQHSKTHNVPQHLVDRLRAEYQDRIHQLTTHEHDENGHLTLYSPEYEDLAKQALSEERKAVLNLRNQRVINDHVLRRIQRDIDLAETRLERHPEDFEM